MKIAIIPARGGSKRIPRKNIKLFCGKPMITWAIEAAIASGIFNRILVSTDDDEIAEVAISSGAEILFKRPRELSDDFTGTTEVIAHTLLWLKAQQYEVSAACCIYATSPLLESDDLIRGLQLLESGDWDYAFSATEFNASVYRSFKKSKEGGVEMLFPEFFYTRSQDLPKTFHDAGQFYWGRSSAWTAYNKIFSEKSVPVLIPRIRVQDIDTPEDWLIAEQMFNVKSKGLNI